MVGGSLQTRLDVKPRDVAYLNTMGHFDAAPKPLTCGVSGWRAGSRRPWRRSCSWHTRSPCVLHRDFKPANILLDANLHFLGDTGFAKAAQRSGDASKLHGATTNRVMGSVGYAHKDVLAGLYSEHTPGAVCTVCRC